jgi:hypothetical protein
LAVLYFATANAEFLRVTAANTVGNSVYNVNITTPPPTPPVFGTTLINNDGAAHGSFDAVVHVANNVTGTVDVLVADSTNGQIIRYSQQPGGPTVAGTVVFSYTGPGSGPAHPDGLSVDSAGNLYIVTSKHNDSTTPSIWVLPAANNYSGPPLLIDSASFSANGVTTIQETAVATSNSTAWNAGDLLVLVGIKNQSNDGNIGVLIKFTSGSIASVLSGGGPRTAPDLVLITSGQLVSGEFPVGMDFWPADVVVPGHTTMLLATSTGRLLRYDFTVTAGGVVPNIAQVVASGLGSGLQKVKVGQQLQTPSAFVTQQLANNTGQILELGAPNADGTNNVIGTATQNVQAPDGIAVAPLNAVAASTCLSNCDVSGVDKHKITGPKNLTGNVLEQTCVVASDPRVSGGVCDGTELQVSTLCPGFGNEVIPGNMCGGSGASGTAFALVRTVANGVDNLPNSPLIVATEENVDNILPGANPGCQAFPQNSPPPFAVIAWGPRQEGSLATPVFPEGTIVETETNPVRTQLVELTGACDNSLTLGRGASIFAIGLTLNAFGTQGAGLNGDFATYAKQKNANLRATVDGATKISAPTKAALDTALDQVAASLTQGFYACAANQVVALDQSIASPSGFIGDTNNPNPWGEIRGRLANLYLTLNTFNLHNDTNHEWPLVPPDAPPACPPIVTLTANPIPVQWNAASTLTWTSQYAASCTVTGASLPKKGLSGLSGSASTGKLTSTTPFTLTCAGLFGGSQASTTTTVTVLPK